MSEVITLPIWKHCLGVMKADGMTYGSRWPVEFFEKHLRCGRDAAQFAFEMLALKQNIEDDCGYYLQQIESGKFWVIPQAAEHEGVARGFEHRMRRYAVRSISIRSSTLDNPEAKLSNGERAKMESNLEKASVRLLIMSRQKSVEKVLLKREPKLLAK